MKMARLLIVAALAVCLFAQDKSSPAKVRRDAMGRPDLSGIWQGIGVSLFGETGEVRPGEGRSSTWGPPAGPPPYQEWALSKVKELASDDRKDPNVQCKMSGTPRITGIPVPFEIAQTAKKTYILYESNHIYRIIPTDGRPHPADLDPTYMGDSVGSWDGDTFVVDVTGFNDKTWLPGAGHFHSEDLHVVERLRRVNHDTLTIDTTIEDPKAYTKPWGGHATYDLKPDWNLGEMACADNVTYGDMQKKSEGSK